VVQPYGERVYATDNNVSFVIYDTVGAFSAATAPGAAGPVAGAHRNNDGVCSAMSASFLYRSFGNQVGLDNGSSVLNTPAALGSVNSLKMTQGAFVGMGSFQAIDIADTFLGPMGLEMTADQFFGFSRESWLEVLEEVVSDPGRYYCYFSDDHGQGHAVAFITDHDTAPGVWFFLDPNFGLYKTNNTNEFVNRNADFMMQVYSEYRHIHLIMCKRSRIRA
jgi:hypothetical protein